jgi:hypothetical protein
LAIQYPIVSQLWPLKLDEIPLAVAYQSVTTTLWSDSLKGSSGFNSLGSMDVVTSNPALKILVPHISRVTTADEDFARVQLDWIGHVGAAVGTAHSLAKP